eukprot:XP_020404731.1 vegetative cell wall protein gp1-like [Zea mays]
MDKLVIIESLSSLLYMHDAYINAEWRGGIACLLVARTARYALLHGAVGQRPHSLSLSHSHFLSARNPLSPTGAPPSLAEPAPNPPSPAGAPPSRAEPAPNPPSRPPEPAPNPPSPAGARRRARRSCATRRRPPSRRSSRPPSRPPSARRRAVCPLAAVRAASSARSSPSASHTSLRSSSSYKVM